mgnify:CR=1 FL=1
MAMVVPSGEISMPCVFTKFVIVKPVVVIVPVVLLTVNFSKVSVASPCTNHKKPLASILQCFGLV